MCLLSRYRILRNEKKCLGYESRRDPLGSRRQPSGVDLLHIPDRRSNELLECFCMFGPLAPAFLECRNEGLQMIPGGFRDLSLPLLRRRGLQAAVRLQLGSENLLLY